MMKVAALPEYLKAEMRRQQFAAVYVAGPNEIIATRIGDNRGARPIRIGITTSWADGITNGMNGASSICWQGLLWRVWVQTIERAKMLESLVNGSMTDVSDPMRLSWSNMGPEFDLKKFSEAIRQAATDYNIRTWSDDELHTHLRNESNRKKDKAVRALRTRIYT